MRHLHFELSPGVDEASLSALGGQKANAEASVADFFAVEREGVAELMGFRLGLLKPEKEHQKGRNPTHGQILMLAKAIVGFIREIPWVWLDRSHVLGPHQNPSVANGIRNRPCF